MRHKEIGGCGWVIWRRMRSSWCAVRASAAWSFRRDSCSVGIRCRLIRSSSICNFGCVAKAAIGAAVFASPSSTIARAAIIPSRGWSGWLWRGSSGRSCQYSTRHFLEFLRTFGIKRPVLSARAVDVHLGIEPARII